LIMGEDNLQSFHKWKNYEVLLENYNIYVYPRIFKEKKANFEKYQGKYTFVDSPIIEISSTFIRNAVKEKKDIRPMLPEKVWKYIDQMNFYK